MRASARLRAPPRALVNQAFSLLDERLRAINLLRLTRQAGPVSMEYLHHFSDVISNSAALARGDVGVLIEREGKRRPQPLGCDFLACSLT
jgi:hypothetical protein